MSHFFLITFESPCIFCMLTGICVKVIFWDESLIRSKTIKTIQVNLCSVKFTRELSKLIGLRFWWKSGFLPTFVIKNKKRITAEDMYPVDHFIGFTFFPWSFWILRFVDEFCKWTTQFNLVLSHLIYFCNSFSKQVTRIKWMAIFCDYYKYSQNNKKQL